MAFAIRLCVLCIAVVATIAPDPASAENVTLLLTRMRAAAGVPYRAHVRSVFHSTEDGVNVTTTTDAQAEVFRTQTCAQTLCAGFYFDGTTLDRVDFNQTALPNSQLGGPYAQSLHDAEYLSFLSPTFRGTIHDAGATTVNGRTYRALLIAPHGGVSVRIDVDERTALLASVADPRAPAPTRFYSDYRKVGSFVMPFTVRTGSSIVRYDSRVVASGALAPPTGLHVQLTNAAPLQTSPDVATPIGPCTLAGVPTRCLIDTGNSGMSVSLQLAERLNLPVLGGGEVHGIGGYATEVVRAGPLAIGNALVAPANYTVLDGIESNGYDIVVGTDALAATRVLIDPSARLVRFGAAPATGATTLDLSFSEFVPIVQTRLGDVTARLLLDTGDQSGIDLSSNFYAAHPDAFVPTRERGVSGVGGSSVQLLGQAPYVALGNLVLRDQTIGTSPAIDGLADGHLGAGFLTQFLLVLDYANRRVQLKDLASPGAYP